LRKSIRLLQHIAVDERLECCIEARFLKKRVREEIFGGKMDTYMANKKRLKKEASKLLIPLVGGTGIEPATSGL
jgi:hypothetical protein